MNFETEHQLKEFRATQDDLFDTNGQHYKGTPVSSRQAEQMLKLINQMELEIIGLSDESNFDTKPGQDEKYVVRELHPQQTLPSDLKAEYMWQEYLEKTSQSEPNMGEIQRIETKRAFHGGLGVLLIAMRDRLTRYDDTTAEVYLIMMLQDIQDFWEQEMKRPKPTKNR